MTYASNFTNKATIFDNGDTIAGDHVKAIYDQLGAQGTTDYPPPVIGRYHNGHRIASATGASTSWSAGQVTAVWFVLPASGTLDLLGAYIATAGASGTLRIGLYEADDTAAGLPGTLIVAHSGTLSTTSTGFVSAAISQTTTARGVWACVQTGVAAAQTRIPSSQEFWSLGRTAGTDASVSTCIAATRTDAALGSLAGTSWTYSTSLPHGVYVRYSA